MRILLVLLGCSILLATAHSPASAQCRCIGANESTDYRWSARSSPLVELQAAHAVFIGELISKQLVGDVRDSYVAYTFKVYRVWKRDLSATVVVKETGPCRLAFKQGERYLVYAFESDASLWARYCSRTREADDAASDIAAFETQPHLQASVLTTGNPVPPQRHN